MICTDDDVFRGNPKVQTPKTESTDYDTSSSDESSVAKPVKVELSNEKPQPESIKKESCDTSPVGLMARDPDGPNPYEIVLDSDSDVEVHEHGPISIQPNERVTMGKRHRKAVLDGISKLNKHDMMIQNGLELIPHSNRDCKTVVLTSHPFVFVQESGQPSIDVIDVGVGASHLDPEFDPKDFCNLLDGYQNIVIAIGYNSSDDPLGHGRFLGEVELMCDLDSCGVEERPTHDLDPSLKWTPEYWSTNTLATPSKSLVVAQAFTTNTSCRLNPDSSSMSSIRSPSESAMEGSSSVNTLHHLRLRWV